jgi:two-component system chemotaxis response regulator CheY
LLVDDSTTMLMSLRATLEMSGFKVSSAGDGEAALALLRSGLVPDLIITDINMPKLDGLGLIAAARKQLRFTPILALTKEGDGSKREEAKQLGATGWLVKPVGGHELLAVIRRVLPARSA